MFFVNINFPGGRESQVEKSRKFQGVGWVFMNTPWNGNSRGVGGLRRKKPPWEVWIFSGTTQYIVDECLPQRCALGKFIVNEGEYVKRTKKESKKIVNQTHTRGATEKLTLC